MTDAAIQKDVGSEEIVVGNTVRNEMLESIAERSRQERDQELGIVQEEKPEELEQKLESQEDTPKEPEHTEVMLEDKPETVKIKVDGEEREVPKDKIYDAGIRAMQKESSADKRLEEATRLLREIEQKYAQPQQKADPSPEWDDETVAYALEHGSEEQKAYAIKQIRGREQATPEQIAEITTKRVLDTVDFKDSSEWFLKEYSDVAGDPYLLQLAAIAEDKARSGGDTRTRKELYKTIGEDLRKWKGGMTASKTLDDKREQKSNIVNLPSASMKKKAPEEPKTPSAADTIEKMRQARGQR